MKKLLTLAVTLLLLSCNSETKYSNCILTTYNLNKEATNKIMASDTTKGDFIITTANEITISGFRDTKVLNTENNYLSKQTTVGDTLIIQHFPTEQTPDNTLKYGFEYKFYN